MNDRNTGFNAAEIIISLAVVAVIGGLTYVLLGSSESIDQQEGDVSSEVSKADKEKSDRLKEADLLVRDAYNTYLSEYYRDEPDEEAALKDFNQNTTDQLAINLSQAQAANPILCSQNIPERLEFSDPKFKDEAIRIDVSGYFESQTVKINVTVDPQLMKISSIDCPSNSVN